MLIKLYRPNGLTKQITEDHTYPIAPYSYMQLYYYNGRNQLKSWNYSESSQPLKIENYTYDSLGNRKHRGNTYNDARSEYSYSDTKGHNRLSAYDNYTNNLNLVNHVNQKYHTDGALYLKTNYTTLPSVNNHLFYAKIEEFYYNNLNLTNKYISREGQVDTIYPQLYLSTPRTEWRYRFNPFGEREQKRMYNSPFGDMGYEMYPWVYYQLGIDNKQYAVYYGAQTNNSYVNMSNITMTAKPDPNRETVFFYPVEYNVYGNESSPKITYKYVDGYWQKQYKIYDYLGSLRYTISQMNTVLNYKAYDPYGNEIIDTLKQTRQGYIGKENDVENGLGDHGVRKYDPSIGRFDSKDQLWELYLGWSPYQYAFNNPLNLKDIDGKVVRALDAASRNNIIGSVEPEYRKYVECEKDGTVTLNHKVAPFVTTGVEMTNYTALQELVNSNKIIEVSQSQEFIYKNKEGQTETGIFGDNFLLNGITLLPDAPNDPVVQTFSTSKNIKVIIPTKSPQDGGTKNIYTAHELYSHALFYLLGFKAAHYYDKNHVDQNIPLKTQAKRAEDHVK